MDIRKSIQDAAYVTVGFGVITFQQAQVRRREATARLESRTRDARTYVGTRARDAYDRATGVRTVVRQVVEPVVDEVRQRVEPVVGQVKTRVEPLVGQVQGQLQAVPDRLAQVAQQGAARFNGTPSTN
jgi:hypothetical protein